MDNTHDTNASMSVMVSDLIMDSEMLYGRLCIFLMFAMCLARFIWFATPVDLVGLITSAVILFAAEIGRVVHKARVIAIADLTRATDKLKENEAAMRNAVLAGVELEKRVAIHEGRLSKLEAGGVLGAIRGR